MRLNISKSDLGVAISRVQGAIVERNLASIGLKASEGKLRITSADRVLAVYCCFDCDVKEEGVVFVPAKFFSDVVRELPQGDVELFRQGAWLIVQAGSGRSEFTMKIPVSEDLTWKEAPKLSWSSVASIPAIKLAYMVDQVQFCIAQDSSRNYGAVGFLHKAEPDTLRLVGTDGFRLSYCDISFDMPEGFLDKGVCISKRSLGEVVRMCHEGFEQVSLSISSDESTLCAQVENYQIYVLLTAVKYPNYQGVLPGQQPANVTVSRPVLQSVAKRVLLAAGKTKALQLNFKEHALVLSSKNMGNAEGQELLNLEQYTGPNCHLAVNGKFLSDVFSTTNSDELNIKFKDEEDPVVVVPVSEPVGCKSKHVLVPIRESD